MKKKICLSVSCMMLVFAFSAASQNTTFKVPYVPTPHNVVKEMLEIADVGANDLLIDLGCGDGRIVITAAERFGTKGIGVDIAPDRIEVSRKNAAAANVSDKVKFWQQNLFDIDISRATVVTLHLLTDLNLKLRPKLFRDLKPGTRVVSHNFSMREWKPDKKTEVEEAFDTHSVYLWYIPSNISGTWAWSMPSGPETIQCSMELRQKYQVVDGSVTTGSSEMLVQCMNLMGDTVRFFIDMTIGTNSAPLVFEGKIDGDTILGTIQSERGIPGGKCIWLAERLPATKRLLYDPSRILRTNK